MPKNKVKLMDYQLTGTTYGEHFRRFCIRANPTSEKVVSYEVDIQSKKVSYFKKVYQGVQNAKSADGLYIGQYQTSKGPVSCVIVIELEGKGTSFDDAAEQVKQTIEHFDVSQKKATLLDDGSRHHSEAKANPDYYLATPNHIVAGLVIGSKGRLYDFKFVKVGDKKYPILCINSRQPAQDQNLVDLLREFKNNIPDLSWSMD